MSKLELPYGESFSYNLSGYRDVYSLIDSEDSNGTTRTFNQGFLKVLRKVELLNKVYQPKGQIFDFECDQTFQVATNTKDYENKSLFSIQPRIEDTLDPDMTGLDTLSIYRGGYISVSDIGESQGRGLYEGFKPLVLSKFGNICISLSEITNNGASNTDAVVIEHLIPIESDHRIALAA